MTISTAKTEVQCILPMKKPLDMEIKERNKANDKFRQPGKEGLRSRNIKRRHQLTHRSCSRSRQGIDKHLEIKWHLYQNKGQIIQDIGACSTVIQLRDVDIEGGANSEATRVWDDGFDAYQGHHEKRPAQKCGCSEGASCHSRCAKRSTAQTTLVRSRGTHVAVSCAQPLTLRQSGRYKTTQATKEEMAVRFTRGFQDCWHHPTGGGVHGKRPTVVESRCLSAAGMRRPVCCVGVADALSQVKSHIY